MKCCVSERKLGTQSREGGEERPLPRHLKAGGWRGRGNRKCKSRGGSGERGGCEEWAEVRATRPGGPAWSSDLTGRAGGPFQAMFLITLSQKNRPCAVWRTRAKSCKI